MELCLEAIGDDEVQYCSLWESRVREVLPEPYASAVANTINPRLRRPWVAEIVGLEGSARFLLEWQHGRKDYRRANSDGSRGIWVWYTLREGRYYWVQSLESWSRTERYYCRIEQDEASHMTEEEVRTCLRSRSALTS